MLMLILVICLSIAELICHDKKIRLFSLVGKIELTYFKYCMIFV